MGMADIVSGPAGRIARVRALMEERGYDAVVVRDEANLRWLTGAEGVFDFTGELPHAAFITADACFLHTDSRYYNSFVEHMPEGSPWELDMEAVAIPTWVAERARATRCRVVAVEDTMELAFYTALMRALEDASIAAALPQMHGDLRRMRAVKDEEELALMRRAQAITDAAFQHMLTFIQPGMTEKAIKLELENFMYESGADGLAFASIVASGPNAANPHAIPSDRVVQKGEFVLMDYGARYRDYNSDMTRTVCLGEPTEEMRKVYDTVLKAQLAGIAKAKAGVPGKEIHNTAAKVIEDAGYGAYFGHGFGHSVGIEIHESPNANGRDETPMPAGAAVSAEPGIYLPGKFGVRIEDVLIYTEEGNVNLTKSPKELIIL